MVAVMESIGFADLVVVDAKGSAGGLCVMWKAGVSVHSVEHNNNLIAVKVVDAMRSWLLVGFYGPPYPTKKQKA